MPADRPKYNPTTVEMTPEQQAKHARFNAALDSMNDEQFAALQFAALQFAVHVQDAHAFGKKYVDFSKYQEHYDSIYVRKLDTLFEEPAA